MDSAPQNSADAPIRIGIFAYPGVSRSAIYGLGDMIEKADDIGRSVNARSVRVVHVATEQPGDLPQDLPDDLLDAIVLPPSAVNAAPDAHRTMLDWIRSQHQAGAIVCSVCAGAFMLGRTGLLDGRRATTHWALKESFAQAFPAVKLEIDRLLIDDGDIITAAGLLSWVDLGLWLVNRFLSPVIMLEVARHFLADPRGREQRFYSSFSPQLNHGDTAILKVQHRLQLDYAKQISVAEMADIATMNGRTFLRRFQNATGLNPVAYLQLLRVGKAREMLELSSTPVSQIAWQVGYEDASAFRKIFQRTIGITPGEYRKRFGLVGG
jgi:transcriptional regulator GlxA family with amidase domain